jgi:hypothetical protein
MKTDRELLELAAKAAGQPIEWIIPLNAPNESVAVDPVARRRWSPLTDDGDALRLAVMLNMSVEISEYEDSTYAYAGPQPRVYGYEMWASDKSAATRRAIVRAAAEVGATKET